MTSSELLAGDSLATSDTPLLHAARIKLQSLIGLAEDLAGDSSVEKYPSLPVVQDYNQLLALVRRAVPELKSVFPPDIMTSHPTEDKFAQFARWSVWYHIFKLWRPSPKTGEAEGLKLLSYREFLTLCRQIERLLK
jgi:hypothetical protein